MKLTSRRALVAVPVIVGTVVCSAIAASAAYADEPLYNPDTNNSAFPWHLDPANEVAGGYTATVQPSSRTGGTGQDAALVWGPGDIRIDRGCPVGYRVSTRQFVVTQAGTETEVVVPIVAGPSDTRHGFHDGETIHYSSPTVDLPQFSRTNANSLPTGVNALVFTCDPTADSSGPAAIPDGFTIANSKYFVLWLKVDRDAVHWEITSDPRQTTKTATTTTLASSNVSQTGATLTATVAPAAATGTVQFKKDGVAVGSPVAVSGGTAATTVDGLTAGTAYPFTAEYSGDSTYEASTGSVTVTTVSAPVQDDSSSPVTVTVPAAGTATPTGLKISVKPGALALTGSATRTQGQTWDATGQLDTVTVNDDRQNASAGGWTLNGRISALTSGSNSIAASNVGWKPEKVDGSGTAGAEVTAGANGGLGADKPFATGNASADANVATKVKATVTLTTPAEAPSGDYTGTLTLTLI